MSTLTLNQGTKSPANKPTAPVTLEQKRAQFAWRYAESGISASGDKYRNLAKAAPAMIMNNGLMQTLAFFNSKNEHHHQALAEHVRRWLSVRNDGPDRDVGFAPAMTAMLDFTPDQYRRATDEALLILRWIRQFAAAL